MRGGGWRNLPTHLPGTFRPMIGGCRQALHPIVAETGTQPVEQQLELLQLFGGTAEEISLHDGGRRELERFQLQTRDGRRQHELMQPLARELQEQSGIARGCRQADRKIARRTLVVFQSQRETQYRTIASAQVTLKLQQQSLQRKKQRGGIAQFAAELAS